MSFKTGFWSLWSQKNQSFDVVQGLRDEFVAVTPEGFLVRRFRGKTQRRTSSGRVRLHHSVCPPYLPDGIQLRLREEVADAHQEGEPPELVEGSGSEVRAERLETPGSKVRAEALETTESEKGVAQGSRVEAAGLAPKGSGIPLQEPPQDPKEELVEVTVQVEPTPAVKAKSGKGKSEKGTQGAKGSVGIGKADINALTAKKQPKPPTMKAAPKGRGSGSAPSAPSAPSKPAGPGPPKAGGVGLEETFAVGEEIHLKPRADAMRSNPPLGRRWTAHPKRRRSTKPKPTTQDRSTQTPAVQTVIGHSTRNSWLWKLRPRQQAASQTWEPDRALVCVSSQDLRTICRTPPTHLRWRRST